MDPRQLLSAFRHTDDETASGPPKRGPMTQISYIAAAETGVQKKRRKSSPKEKCSATELLPDLAPSIGQNLTVIFIGFNPGILSSKTQHHYAHPTNLFWKLFNAVDMCRSVLQRSQREGETETLIAGDTDFARGQVKDRPADADIPKQNGTRSGDYSQDWVKQRVLEVLGSERAGPQHDYSLSEMGIGFTDLVLRCTRQASELSMQEKLLGVPRLFSEFSQSQAPFLVFIGKGIWEVFCRFMQEKLGNFRWGLQTGAAAAKFRRHCAHEPRVYVFPSTSGLVASVPYKEKLEMWEVLSRDVASAVT